MNGILFIFAACSFWAIDTLFRYPLLGKGVSAERIVFSEHVFLTIIFLPILIKGFKKFRGLGINIFYLFIIGVFGSAVATFAFTKAFTLINPSLVILLQKMQPLVAITLAHIFIGERFGRKFVLWALVCIVGGFLISYQDIFPGLTSLEFGSGLLNTTHLTGYALALIAVLGWGSSTVFGKKLSMAGLSSWEIMAGRFSFGLLGIIPFVLVSKNFSLDSNLNIWGTILIMAVLTGVISMYLYYQGLKRLSARVCTLAELFFPLAAISVNWFVLDATLDSIQLAGGALLLLGSTVIQLKKY